MLFDHRYGKGCCYKCLRCICCHCTNKVRITRQQIIMDLSTFGCGCSPCLGMKTLTKQLDMDFVEDIQLRRCCLLKCCCDRICGDPGNIRPVRRACYSC